MSPEIIGAVSPWQADAGRDGEFDIGAALEAVKGWAWVGSQEGRAITTTYTGPGEAVLSVTRDMGAVIRANAKARAHLAAYAYLSELSVGYAEDDRDASPLGDAPAVRRAVLAALATSDRVTAASILEADFARRGWWHGHQAASSFGSAVATRAGDLLRGRP